MFHAVEFPAVTEGVEEKMETSARVGPIELPAAFAQVAFLGHAASDHAARVLEVFDVELALELGPFGGELFVLEQGFFLFIEFFGLFEHFFVAARFDVVLELGDDGLGFGRRRRVDKMQNGEGRVQSGWIECGGHLSPRGGEGGGEIFEF